MDKPMGRDHRDGFPAAVTARPTAAELDAFARALAGLEGQECLDALLHRGPAAWLRREVFAPAARRLGDWWLSDDICFLTVTLGMSQLQRLAWAHGRATPQHSPLRPAMVLAAMPGEQHTFGLNMLVEELRERGVEPAMLPCPTREALVAAAGSGRFAIIGLSAGSDAQLADVAPLARALRRAAPERIRLLLGGPVVQTDATIPGIDEILGGDGAVDRLYVLASQATFKHAAAA